MKSADNYSVNVGGKFYFVNQSNLFSIESVLIFDISDNNKYCDARVVGDKTSLRHIYGKRPKYLFKYKKNAKKYVIKKLKELLAKAESH